MSKPRITAQELKVELSWGLGNLHVGYENDGAFIRKEDTDDLSETENSKLQDLLDQIDWEVTDKGIWINLSK